MVAPPEHRGYGIDCILETPSHRIRRWQRTVNSNGQYSSGNDVKLVSAGSSSKEDRQMIEEEELYACIM
jgi:hypothetical protein